MAVELTSPILMSLFPFLHHCLESGRDARSGGKAFRAGSLAGAKMEAQDSWQVLETASGGGAAGAAEHGGREG